MKNLFKISIDKDYYKPKLIKVVIIKIMLNMKVKEIRY